MLNNAASFLVLFYNQSILTILIMTIVLFCQGTVWTEIKIKLKYKWLQYIKYSLI